MFSTHLDTQATKNMLIISLKHNLGHTKRTCIKYDIFSVLKN